MPSTWAVVYHTIYQAILEPGIDMMGFYATAIVYRGESDFWQNKFEYVNEKKKKIPNGRIRPPPWQSTC